MWWNFSSLVGDLLHLDQPQEDFPSFISPSPVLVSCLTPFVLENPWVKGSPQELRWVSLEVGKGCSGTRGWDVGVSPGS